MTIGCTSEMVSKLWVEGWKMDYLGMRKIIDNSNWESYLRNDDGKYGPIRGINHWLTTLPPNKLNHIYESILKIYKWNEKYPSKSWIDYKSRGY